jgi:hypothetical protein
MRRDAAALLVLCAAACVEQISLVHELPAQGSRAYDVRWRAGANFTLHGGAEKRAEAEVSGRLVVEPAGPGHWRARMEGVTQRISVPPEAGVRPDAAAMAGLLFVLSRPAGGRTSVSALAKPPASVLPFLTPKTALLAMVFPPLPPAPVKRGARWDENVPVTWPHPHGSLDGHARLRARLAELRREEGARLAVVRVTADAEARSLSPRAPAYRGSLRADVILDLARKVVRRAVVEEEWVAAMRDAAGQELRMKMRGEWTMALTASPPPHSPSR